MFYQEKRAIVSIISTVLINIIYFIYVFQIHLEGNANSINDLSFWGTVILILIAVSIITQIIIHIVFSIINKIVTNEDVPSITDELDKLIELKSTRNAHYVFMISFLLSMVTLVIDVPPYVMFIVLIVGGFVSAIVSDLSQLHFYRKGV